MTTPSTPAGWYPDPDDPRGLRYWDGNAWTEHRSDAAHLSDPEEPAAEAPQPEPVQPEEVEAEPVQPEAAEPAPRPSFETMPFEPPTFESFETPSFEDIASGAFTTPAPPPPAAEVESESEAESAAAAATSALEVPGTFSEPAGPAAPATHEAPSYSPTWASDAPSISETPAAFATPHGAPPAAPPASAGGSGAGGSEGRRLLIAYLSAVGALLLILILILVYAFVIRDTGQTEITSSTPSESALESTSADASATTSGSAPESTTETAAAAAPGEVVDGPFTISVSATERGDTISSTSNEYLEKTAVGEFFVVYLNVGNTSGDVQEFLSTLQVLNTDAGTITPDDEASFYLGGGVVSISPGEVVETAIAFDVPVGTVASGIVVHGVPGMAGGELPVE